MGYRSQVGYVIQGKKEEIIPILMSYRLTYKDSAAAKQALDECTFGVYENFITIKFEEQGVKWYEEYSDVKCHTSLFNAFREAAETEGSSVNGMFMRVGENDDDVETKSYGLEPYDLVRLNRELKFEVTADGNLESVLK